MPTIHNVVIIGSGPNGLVTAFYLAKAGLKPLVLERRTLVGGAAITEEIHPGFKCSALAHTDGPLSPQICEEMRLARHGLKWIRPDPMLFAPAPDGRALLIHRVPGKTSEELARFSRRDAQSFVELEGFLNRIASELGHLLTLTPPNIQEPATRDLWDLFHAGRRLRKLGDQEMLRLLRWGPMPIADLVAELFETELLRAVTAFLAIFGNFHGPRSPGSSAIFLLRCLGDARATGAVNFPRGGMGSLTQAMASAAREAGAEIRTGVEVAQITVRNGAAVGVVLSNGEEIPAKMAVSNADPRRTFLRLLDPVHLTPEFLGRMQHYRCMGTVAKVNLALAGLPTFTALRNGAAGGIAPPGALAGRIHIGPQIDYLERAFDDAKYGDLSRAPILDVTIPSLSDSTLAPAGKHVMSVCAQFAPFKLKQGEWKQKREALGDVVVQTLSAYAPDLSGLLLHRQVITPQDLEDVYGLTGGHIFHGELAFDQLFTMRPLLGWARYRAPIENLYLCGSGTHPGTGLTGASGFNAAREILRDWKKLKRL